MKKKKAAAVIMILCIVCVPLLYSGVYLHAFWDPYGKIDQLPVAVINLDEGAQVNGRERNYGKELCDELEQKKPMKLTFTNEKQAQAGTDGDQFYAYIKIPKDFSAHIASASELDKKQADIEIVQNEKKNYLAVTILKSAVSEIQKNITASVDKEIVAQLSDQLREVPVGLTDLQDGLMQLRDGSLKLKDGTKALQKGAGTLQNGAADLAVGAKSAREGAEQLQSGTVDLNQGAQTLHTNLNVLEKSVKKASKGAVSISKGAASLNEGMDALQTGVKKLDTNTKDLARLNEGAVQLAEQADAFNQGMTEYTNGVSSLLSTTKATMESMGTLFQYIGTTEYKGLLQDPQVQNLLKELAQYQNPDSEQAKQLRQLTAATNDMAAYSSQISVAAKAISTGTSSLPALKQGIKDLRQGVEAAQKGSESLAKGSSSLSNHMQEFNQAAIQLAQGSQTLAEGADSLEQGMRALTAGSQSLETGADQLSAGAGSLYHGVKEAKTGVSELAAGTRKAEKQVGESVDDSNTEIQKLDGLDQYASDPVQVEKKDYHVVPNYGTSFTPYFMSLSLWVGALLALMGIYYDVEDKYRFLSRNSQKHVLRSLAYEGIGVVQAVILSAALVLLLKLDVKEMGLYLLAAIATALTFTAIVQFLLVYLKDMGKIISIVLLILQLSTSGGTFPLELIPDSLRNLSQFLPMTYSVALFKEVTCGSDPAFAWKNIGVLACYLGVFLALVLVFSWRHDHLQAQNKTGAVVDSWKGQCSTN